MKTRKSEKNSETSTANGGGFAFFVRILPRGYLHDSLHSRHPSRQPRFCSGSQGVLLAQNAFLAPFGRKATELKVPSGCRLASAKLSLRIISQIPAIIVASM